MCIAEAIKDIIKDKVVCDIGCREGDLMVAFSKYAKEVIGIEKIADRVRICRRKGFDYWFAPPSGLVNQTTEGDAMTMDIPHADVYYIWVHHSKANSLNVNIARRIKKLKPKSTIIVGGDLAAGETYDELTGEVRRVEYNEGDGIRQSGVFQLKIITKGYK